MSEKDKIAHAKKVLGDLKTRTEGGGDGTFIYLKDGKNVFRILPVETQETDFWRTIKKHFQVGPNKEVVKCPTTIGKKCRICLEVQKSNKKQKASSGKGGKDKAKWVRHRSAVKTNYLLDVYPIEPNKPKAAKVLEVGTKVFQDIIRYYVEVDEFGPITSLKEGRDVVVIKTGEGLKTEYDVKLRDADKSVKLKSTIMDSVPDLDALVSEDSFPSSKKIEAILEGIDYDDDDDADDDDEAPKKKKSKKPAAEDDDSDDEASEEEESSADDDDAEEPPKKKGKKPADDGEEESSEEEADDAEEEDEPPKKKGKKPADDEDEDEESGEEESEEDADEDSDDTDKRPGCFGSVDDHDPKDQICKDCDHFSDCSKLVFKRSKGEKGNKDGKLISVKSMKDRLKIKAKG